MKAYRLHGVNDLQYEDIEIPECPTGWCIVQVKAAGICSSDVPRIFTNGTYHFPTIPGHEFSGIVTSVNDKNAQSLLGKHVGVFPLIPCKQCSQCTQLHFEMCENYNYVGSRCDGAFAEYVAVPIWNVLPLPDSIPFAEAATMEPLSVALHACKIASIKKNDNVAIVGTGMIGICAAQWAKNFGAQEVTVVGRNAKKKELVSSLGIAYLDSTKDSIPNNVEIVIEAVGTPSSIDQAINMVKPGGVLVLMGNPSGDIPLTQKTYWRILRKQINVKGTWNSSYNGLETSDWTMVVDALLKKSIKVSELISHQFDQSELMDALLLMKNHTTDYCKIMTIWNK